MWTNIATGLVALMVCTNYTRDYCSHCDRGDGTMDAIWHTHEIHENIVTNYLPVVERKWVKPDVEEGGNVDIPAGDRP